MDVNENRWKEMGLECGESGRSFSAYNLSGGPWRAWSLRVQAGMGNGGPNNSKGAGVGLSGGVLKPPLLRSMSLPPGVALPKWSLKGEVPVMRLSSQLAVKAGARRSVVPELGLEGGVSSLPPSVALRVCGLHSSMWERSHLLSVCLQGPAPQGGVPGRCSH